MFRVMLVDDEKYIRRKFLTNIPWEDFGFTVVGTAANGEAALADMDTLAPDVVITDIRMPKMDGLELISRLRQSHPHIKTVILSGYGEFEYAKLAIKHNAFDYILKPTRIDEIEDVLRRLYSVLQRDSAAPPSAAAAPSGEHGSLIDKAKQYISANLNQKLTLSSVADNIHISPVYLSRLFKQQTGETFVSYLVRCKIALAQSLLQDNPDLRSYEVAERCGFSNAKYFCAVFKEATGFTFHEFKGGAREKPLT